MELDVPYERKEDNLWIISDESRSLQNIAVTLEDSIVTITVNVMQVPNKGKEELFSKLLALNATDLMHGAYAIEGNAIVLLDTLEGETLDLKELQASLDAIGLALTQHYKVLAEYRN
ncbi:MAG: hypothetical protein JW881_05240 [Spirochaetales bacterium]|nr:hypothetical protein [Spirochaetales bacterium]